MLNEDLETIKLKILERSKSSYPFDIFLKVSFPSSSVKFLSQLYLSG